MHPLTRVLSGLMSRLGTSPAAQTKAAVAAPVSANAPPNYFAPLVTSVEITPYMAWLY